MKLKHFQKVINSTRSRYVEVGFCILLSMVAAAAAAPLSRISGIKTYDVAAAARQRLPGGILSEMNQISCLNPLLASIRGGSSDPSPAGSSPPPPQYQSPNYQQPPPPPQQQQQQQEPDLPTDQPHFQEEAFQDRIDTWRKYQLEHAAEQKNSLDPRDQQGRMKLLTSVSKGSRAVTFFFLMWRNVHLYEVVDQKFKGTLRFMGVLPLTLLFVANMAGVVASVTSAGHASKKRLKAILNLDKLMEIFLILSSIFSLLFSTSNLVPREIYVSHILHSVFFIIQCQTVTRFVWDEALPVAALPSEGPEPDEDYDGNQLLQQQRMGSYGTGASNNYQQRSPN